MTKLQSPKKKVVKPKKHLVQIGMMMQKTKKPRAVPLRQGTLTIINQAAIDAKIKRNHQQEDTEQDIFLAGNKKQMPEQAKIKLKWKTIQYLLENKKPQIEMLTSNLKELITEVKNDKKSLLRGAAARSEKAKRLGTTLLKVMSSVETKDDSAERRATENDSDKGLNRDEFAKLLAMIGLGTDKNLIEKLFWIFDDDGNGEVDHKELAVGLEMLKENTFADKIDRFFDICDEDGSGTIDRKEFYNLLKLSMVNYEDVSSLKSLVKKLFAMVDKRGTGEITKQEMQYACQNNQQIKDLIEKNVKILKEVDHWIESDLEKPFHTRITFTLGNSNSRSKGVYYPSINKLVAALEERENVIRNYESIKEENRLNMRKLKGIQHEDESEDEY
ncbi:ef hand domain containing protein [Stylonychia lemnae]|uniref:Ef hand domain containing protein n=1 Tax=Stylonychia lemnae TaxID=5949 RepID=A0A078A719_STYLE|nr:ef hand domain containing protein [Stylonychia lemnae]|eukprot:CDW78050.1 ef hand domain containing protein [Stylonychia lemnae]